MQNVILLRFASAFCIVVTHLFPLELQIIFLHRERKDKLYSTLFEYSLVLNNAIYHYA